MVECPLEMNRCRIVQKTEAFSMQETTSRAKSLALRMKPVSIVVSNLTTSANLAISFGIYHQRESYDT